MKLHLLVAMLAIGFVSTADAGQRRPLVSQTFYGQQKAAPAPAAPAEKPKAAIKSSV